MGQVLTIYVSGLWTSPNNFNAPPGALAIADNIVIDRPNIGETRRGQKRYGDNIADLVTTPGYFHKLYNYDNHLIGYDDVTLFYDSDDAGTWVDYTGDFSPVTNYALRGLEANRNFYVNTSNGIFKIDDIASEFRLAGSPQALQGTFTLTTGTILVDDTAVAYRMVWGYTDANENEIVGAPSQRLIVANDSGSDQDVVLTFQIPDTITEDYFYRIYRSPPSADAESEPSDEVQLVISGNPTGAEITAGLFTVTDSQANLGALLYTNQSQEGILQSNFEPPIAKDMTLWNGYVFYANTIQKQFMNVTITELPTIGDTITVTHTSGVQVYEAAAANNFAAAEFEVVTTGTVEENIRDTTQNLVEVINRNPSNTVMYAYYTSGFNDIQGTFILQNRVISEAAPTFTMTSSVEFLYPTTITSSDQAKQNRISVSKFQQPEAVPILQYLIAGSENFPIRRIIALRDCVFILKDDGIFQITGTDTANFTVSLFDGTIKIVAPEAATALNNAIYFYTSQGVMRVSMNEATDAFQEPIKSTLLQLQSGLFPNFETLTFGMAYDSDQKYILYTVSTADDEFCTQQFVYDYSTNTWTQWKTNRTCGVIGSRDGKLYTGEINDDLSQIFVRQERKDFSRSDYSDLEVPKTIVSFTDFTIELDSTTEIDVGWTVKQGNVREAVITEIVDATHITVDKDDIIWDLAECIIYEPILTMIKLVPFTGGNVGVLKQAQECTYLFDDASFNQITVGFQSNFSSRNSFLLSSTSQGSWGGFPWGTLPWGGGIGGRQPIRTYIPFEQQWGLWHNLDMTLNQAFESMAFMGISIIFENMDTRIK